MVQFALEPCTEANYREDGRIRFPAGTYIFSDHSIYFSKPGKWSPCEEELKNPEQELEVKTGDWRTVVGSLRDYVKKKT